MRIRRARRSIGLALVAAALGACGESDAGGPAGTSASDLSAPPATASSEPVPGDVALLDPCTDVPFITTDVVGDLLGGNPDEALMTAIVEYTQARSETFGGVWLDRDMGGTVVVAMTDDPQPHREALAALFTDRGIDAPAFDVVQVRYPEATILDSSQRVHQAVVDAGFDDMASGFDVRRNRLFIEAGWIDPGDDASIAAAVDGLLPADAMCLTAMVGAPPQSQIQPGATLDVIVLAAEDGSYPPGIVVECDRARFPLGSLQKPTPRGAVDDAGLLAVLDGWLSSGEGGSWPQEGWQLLFADERQARFVQLGPDSMATVDAEMGANGWIWAGAGSGRPCDVRVPLPDGLGQVDWELDPAFAEPGPTSTEIHLLATERGCASGRTLGDQLLGPQVIETADLVAIAFAAIPPPGRGQNCEGNPSTAVTIELGEPLGDRELRDGLVIGPLDELVD